MATRNFTGGSGDGLGIKVAATSTPGTLIDASTGSFNNMYNISALNSSASAVLLTIEFGGTTDPDNVIEYTLPASTERPVSIVSGLILSGGTKNVRAFAGTTNVVVVYGSVNEF